MFADTDPEDAYDAGDPWPDRLTVIATIGRALADPNARDRVGRLLDLARLLRDVARDVERGAGWPADT